MPLKFKANNPLEKWKQEKAYYQIKAAQEQLNKPRLYHGDNVKAINDIRENDWYESAWDGEKEPWKSPAGTKGVITKCHGDCIYEVKFDNGIECTCMFNGADLNEIEEC